MSVNVRHGLFVTGFSYMHLYKLIACRADESKESEIKQDVPTGFSEYS